MKQLTRKTVLYHTTAYIVGYSSARSAAYESGRTNINPSMTQRADYSYAWNEFMHGWNSAMRDISHE